MRFTFRPLGQWPGPSTTNRRGRNTFKAGWSETLSLLDRELDNLAAENIAIQADFRDQDIRLDGMIRADARPPNHPGVIVNFESKFGPLRYLTDTHELWQHNVRAIALGLEALRAVDRYGVTKRGEQYTGWRQLTAGSGLTSKQQALEVIARLTGLPAVLMPADDLVVAYRRALKKAHPDGGWHSRVVRPGAGRRPDPRGDMMPAHLRDIRVERCGRNGCNKPATKELRNTQNGVINTYCDRHANAALAEFKKEVGEK